MLSVKEDASPLHESAHLDKNIAFRDKTIRAETTISEFMPDQTTIFRKAKI